VIETNNDILAAFTNLDTLLPFFGSIILSAIVIIYVTRSLKNKSEEFVTEKYKVLDNKQTALHEKMQEQVNNLSAEVERYRKMANDELNMRIRQEREYELKIEMLKEEIAFLRIELRKIGVNRQFKNLDDF